MNYIVCGPPASGKTRYVRERARPGDLIIDLDEIYKAVSGLPMYDKPEALLQVVKNMRDAAIATIKPRNNPFYNAWVVMGGARREARARLARRLGAEVIVLATPASECKRRIMQDERRKDRAELWLPLVEKWWANYAPAANEREIRG